MYLWLYQLELTSVHSISAMAQPFQLSTLLTVYIAPKPLGFLQAYHFHIPLSHFSNNQVHFPLLSPMIVLSSTSNHNRSLSIHHRSNIPTTTPAIHSSYYTSMLYVQDVEYPERIAGPLHVYESNMHRVAPSSDVLYLCTHTQSHVSFSQ